MAVVINEFEAVPKPPPPAKEASNESPAKILREIEKAARRKAERSHRLSTW